MASFASVRHHGWRTQAAWAKISAMGVSPEWVKSNECREKKKRERAKVNDYNGQYLLPEPRTTRKCESNCTLTQFLNTRH